MMDASQGNNQSPVATSGARDSAGRFGPGSKHGVGRRTPVSAQALLRAYWIDGVTPEQVDEIREAIAMMVRSGDAAAARVWLEYSLGKPRPVEEEAVDEDRQPLVVAPPLPAGVN